MSTATLRRIAAPLLVVAGSALFGIGAGGIARVDARLEAATQPPAAPQTQAPSAVGVRSDRHRWHHGEY